MDFLKKILGKGKSQKCDACGGPLRVIINDTPWIYYHCHTCNKDVCNPCAARAGRAPPVSFPRGAQSARATCGDPVCDNVGLSVEGTSSGAGRCVGKCFALRGDFAGRRGSRITFAPPDCPIGREIRGALVIGGDVDKEGSTQKPSGTIFIVSRQLKYG